MRNIWTNARVERDMGYNDFVRQVAAQEHIRVADMATLEADSLQTLGQSKTALLYPKDHTHTSAEGATLNAEHVAESIRLSGSPLAAYLLPTAP